MLIINRLQINWCAVLLKLFTLTNGEGEGGGRWKQMQVVVVSVQLEKVAFSQGDLQRQRPRQ